MTEAEWVACTDPQKMLEFLHERSSPRKMRLFACACSRAVWRCMTDERGRWAVEVAERFADDGATVEEMKAAADGAEIAEYDAAADADDTDAEAQSRSHAMGAAYWTAASAETAVRAISLGRHPAVMAANAAIDAVVWDALAIARDADYEQEAHRVRAVQARLARCIFGNPFHPVVIDPSWLARNGGTVVRLAQAIYAERAFDRLPILSDALEEAGCHDADILVHCRGPGPHCRGCWVVDALLGKM
jgi:hypothetical protein